MEIGKLRDRRAGEAQTALRVLNVGRDQMNTDRLRAINAVTTLVRAHCLGLDARNPLSASQIKTIAVWREQDEPLGATIDRGEIVRLAKQIHSIIASKLALYPLLLSGFALERSSSSLRYPMRQAISSGDPIF